MSKRSDREYSSLHLTLVQEVMVTESFYPAFSPLSFITMMGGALGWLGVGAVQLVAYLLNAVHWVKKKVPAMLNRNT